MILAHEQITSIIKTNPNKDLVNAGKIYNKKLRMHFYGDMKDDSLPMIEGFEKPTLRSLRVKYAKSNKDLMNRIARPIDKVFSARGGSIYYQLPEAEDKKARGLSMDVKSGYSIKAWLENFWKAHYLDDPCGFTFMEIAAPIVAAKLQADGKSVAYPTYKSIQCVYDYLPNGASLEYIIFTVDVKEKALYGLKPEDVIYRVVDDSFDYLVKWESDTASILKDLSFPNLFMKVPAILNSDIPNPNKDGMMISFFDEILELAENFLLKGSIKLTHDFMHAFPKYWEYADDCQPCKGTGFINADPCPTCKGTGKSIMSKVSDSKLLQYPQDKDTPIVTPNVAGYVSPDKVFYEIATNDLQLLEDTMAFTIWGATVSQRTQGMSTGGPSTSTGQTKTATEVMNDIKPQSDRLHPISDSASKRHKFILDAVIEININQNYQGASVNYGKRYMIESPDELKDKYEDAKTKKVSSELLDILYDQYLEAQYQSDEVKLFIEKKIFKVKPFFHYDATEIESSNFITDLDKLANRYFNDWKKININDAMLLSMSEEILREMLYDFVIEKQVELTPVIKMGSDGKPMQQEGADIIGKIPLALQQLTLAQSRATEQGNASLAKRIGVKIDALLGKVA